MKIVIEVLGQEEKRKNANGVETRFQPIAVFVEGARFPKERKHYLAKRPSLEVGRYSLDLSKKISLEEGSENAPAIFQCRFRDEDLVRIAAKAA